MALEVGADELSGHVYLDVEVAAERSGVYAKARAGRGDGKGLVKARACRLKRDRVADAAVIEVHGFGFAQQLVRPAVEQDKLGGADRHVNAAPYRFVRSAVESFKISVECHDVSYIAQICTSCQDIVLSGHEFTDVGARITDVADLVEFVSQAPIGAKNTSTNLRKTFDQSGVFIRD